jgi:sugar/nucleoside kinase (ribokinase family)
MAAPMSVCLVGNLCIDLIVRGVPRMPAWGQEVAGNDYCVVSSGQTTYTAFALRGLGDEVSVIGAVGDDPWGRQIRADLEARGVGTAGLETATGGRTALSVAAVRPDGERAFVSDFACLNDVDAGVIERGWDLVAGSRIVCLLGVFSWPGLLLRRSAALFARARRAGIETMLDTGWDPQGWQPATLAALRELLAHTTIFMPNSDEAAAITGKQDPAEALRELAGTGPEVVVVKMGSSGSVAAQHGGMVRQPAFPAAVVDAVGAGDVFNAGFLHARLLGRGLGECLAFGSGAASVYIGRRENRFPSAGEVRS